MIITQLVNLRHQDCDIRIDRPGKWGNPFRIGRDGDRATVIAAHRAWIVTQPHLIEALEELRGKRLGCWCHPLACHGNTLIELIHANDPICENDPFDF